MKPTDATTRLAQEAAPQRTTSARDVTAQRDTCVPSGLLDRMDENLTCRRLLDNASLDIDLARTLLSQLAATSEIEQALASLEAEDHPWAPPLSALVDAVFEHLVGKEPGQRRAPHDASGPDPSVLTVECIAAAVESLTRRVARSQLRDDLNRQVVGS